MKVRELLHQLIDLDPDMEVAVAPSLMALPRRPLESVATVHSTLVGPKPERLTIAVLVTGKGEVRPGGRL